MQDTQETDNKEQHLDAYRPDTGASLPLKFSIKDTWRPHFHLSHNQTYDKANIDYDEKCLLHVYVNYCPYLYGEIFLYKLSSPSFCLCTNGMCFCFVYIFMSAFGLGCKFEVRQPAHY